MKNWDISETESGAGQRRAAGEPIAGCKSESAPLGQWPTLSTPAAQTLSPAAAAGLQLQTPVAKTLTPVRRLEFSVWKQTWNPSSRKTCIFSRGQHEMNSRWVLPCECLIIIWVKHVFSKFLSEARSAPILLLAPISLTCSQQIPDIAPNRNAYE